MKETKRLAFNFLRSYFDVLNNLKTDKDKLDFLLAVINKQFLNEDPDKLDFIPNLCYESQRHSIEKSVKGWIRANNGNPPSDPMSEQGAIVPPSVQVQEKGEEKGEEEEKQKGAIALLFKEEINTDKKELFNKWIQYRKEIKKSIKSGTTLNSLIKKINYESLEKCELVIGSSIENQWTGLFWDKVVAKRDNTLDVAADNARKTMELIDNDPRYKQND